MTGSYIRCRAGILDSPGPDGKFHLGPGRNVGRQRNAVEDDAADALYRFPEQAHGNRQRPDAVGNDMDAPVGADVSAQFGNGSRMIEQRDVVEGVAMTRKVIGETATAAVIERPYIAVSLIEQCLHQVLVLRHDEHVGRSWSDHGRATPRRRSRCAGIGSAAGPGRRRC